MNTEQAPLDNSEQKPGRNAPLDAMSRWYEHRIDEIVPKDLNNFHLWMPFSKYVEQFNAFPDILDKPRIMDSLHLHSSKWAAQTGRQFIQTISDAVDTIPGLRERIEEMQKRGAQPQEQHSHLIELYKLLRRQGYSHYDLVA
ncbi:MAG: hypothetical protein AAB375_00815 [Patescibacteria group bacterium]